ncbi:hypothetical protein ABI_28220 [Asticcacaulis biprosthecium C19]|uniref:Uncharacterized protein n=1 Tax=Asticcacaulis biprosthecium C19 TaxID=715226 RepID=F4QMG5_9CAUL|nr:hypothetical protein [Asticcacaulis biprosthecium]EGF91406.1 hypothetical protein ABI_28220 [Asticcacaulis biprosthecium C19]
MRAFDDFRIANRYRFTLQRPAPIRVTDDDADAPERAYKSFRREAKKRSLRQKPGMMR